MKKLKWVRYTGEYKGNVFDIPCWEGSPLSKVWNDEKHYYLPGDVVTITDTKGKSKTFMKGLI